jgi:hypothetical protein
MLIPVGFTPADERLSAVLPHASVLAALTSAVMAPKGVMFNEDERETAAFVIYCLRHKAWAAAVLPLLAVILQALPVPTIQVVGDSIILSVSALSLVLQLLSVRARELGLSAPRARSAQGLVVVVRKLLFGKASPEHTRARPQPSRIQNVALEELLHEDPATLRVPDALTDSLVYLPIAACSEASLPCRTASSRSSPWGTTPTAQRRQMTT